MGATPYEKINAVGVMRYRVITLGIKYKKRLALLLVEWEARYIFRGW